MAWSILFELMSHLLNIAEYILKESRLCEAKPGAIYLWVVFLSYANFSPPIAGQDFSLILSRHGKRAEPNGPVLGANVDINAYFVHVMSIPYDLFHVNNADALFCFLSATDP